MLNRLFCDAEEEEVEKYKWKKSIKGTPAYINGALLPGDVKRLITEVMNTGNQINKVGKLSSYQDHKQTNQSSSNIKIRLIDNEVQLTYKSLVLW